MGVPGDSWSQRDTRRRVGENAAARQERAQQEDQPHEGSAHDQQSCPPPGTLRPQAGRGAAVTGGFQVISIHGVFLLLTHSPTTIGQIQPIVVGTSRKMLQIR